MLAAQRFIHTEHHAGLVLLLAGLIALGWANSPWAESYSRLFDTVIRLDLGVLSLAKDLRHWVNDGLMAIFFFVVGLEVKREFVHGHLSNPRRASLPVAAALGGMVFPAAIYLAFNGQGAAAVGWGIPMATDIAFALGVLALVGPGIPSELRLFLLTLAVADDIGAVLVIAAFYTGTLSPLALVAAGAVLVVIYAAKRAGLRDTNAYVLLGILFWLAVLESGVHATIAGVVLGLLAPASPFVKPAAFAEVANRLVGSFQSALDRGDHEEADALLGELEDLTRDTESPVERMERIVHPWASYGVLPLFALANAGVSLTASAFGAALSSPVTHGVVFGLLLGKPLGIASASWLVMRFKVATLPAGVTWRQMVGVGMLAGIGFTMSIFINDLAFDDPAAIAAAKVGILAASAVAAVVGYTFLRLAFGQREEPEPPDLSALG